VTVSGEAEWPEVADAVIEAAYLASSCIVLNDARVAVAVRDKHLTVLCEGKVCRAAKVSGGIRHISNTDLKAAIPGER